MLWSDLTFAARGLIGAPRLSAAAVLALALGIGPNTAIFSIVYATLLAPLPFPDPDELVRVTPMAGNAQDRASAAEYLEWKKRATSFQALEAFRPGRTLNLAIGDAPEIVIARRVTPGGHSMLSERVFLGRDFRADEDQPGKQHVVLLTHRLWRERFGADRDIIGRDIRMDSIPYTVVGVLGTCLPAAPARWILWSRCASHRHPVLSEGLCPSDSPTGFRLRQGYGETSPQRFTARRRALAGAHCPAPLTRLARAARSRPHLRDAFQSERLRRRTER
jgi:hypothetical protein